MSSNSNYYKTEEYCNFYEMLLNVYNSYKNRTAVKYRKDEQIINISYLELIENICSFYNYFKNNNLNDTNVGIISENRYEYIPIYLGTLFSNVIAPIDREMNESKLRNLLEKFDIKVLFYTNKAKGKVLEASNKLNVKLINIDEEFDEIVADKRNIDEMFENIRTVSKDKFSTLGFTSGTTSDIKGAMLSQYNIVSNLCAAHKNNNLKSPLLYILPMNHTYGFNSGILTAIYKGITICLTMDLKHFQKDLKEYDPYYIGSVPLVVEGVYKNILAEVKRRRKEKLFFRMIKVSKFLLKFKIDIRHFLFGKLLSKNFRLFVSGGASLDESYIHKYNEIGINVLNGYGLTECSPLISVNRDIHNVVGSVGIIIDGVSIKIAEDSEILAKGPNIMMGYYKDENATKEVMTDGYYKTGDLGYVKDNVLFITGRKKNLIILPNGKNFSPEEIEEKLLQVDYIKECVVFSKKHKDIVKINAKIFLEEQSDNLAKDIEIINSGLPYYMRIDEYEIVDEEFEKTSTKKIIRSKYV
ncbi:MAG: AMP-binding protein [Defluviitaleaceae bacterium]|nr:AMP-binding protein [Defluviitaleaceae bacterium]